MGDVKHIVGRLAAAGAIHPPPWLPNNLHYACLMGSVAYGVSSGNSDNDVYGFCVPPKADIFPHLRGEIMGFGKQHKRFNQWQEHHVNAEDSQWDFCVYSIVRFFHLCMDNNPNMVDALFVPTNCVIHATAIGQKVRENRHIFLHRGAWHKLKGYAYSQLHKMEIKSPEAGSRRAASVKEFGYDVKFAYHVVRLLDEIEQILAGGDLNLQRAKETLKAIRRGEWTVAQIREFFSDKERDLEHLYEQSSLPWGPREPEIKALLLECLTMHYGDLGEAVVVPYRDTEYMRRIAGIADEWASAEAGKETPDE